MADKVTEKKELSLSEIIKRTNKEKPNQKDIQLMEKALDNDASFVEANAAANYAFKRVVDSVSNKSVLVTELYGRNMKNRRSELDYENENAMVRMLIDNVILCQMRMAIFEAFHAERLQKVTSIKEGLYFDKLLTSYHRRFTRACEALAAVKRVLCEANLLSERAKNKRSQSTLQSARLYKSLSDS
jgi:hypothetical protein